MTTSKSMSESTCACLCIGMTFHFAQMSANHNISEYGYTQVFNEFCIIEVLVLMAIKGELQLVVGVIKC